MLEHKDRGEGQELDPLGGGGPPCTRSSGISLFGVALSTTTSLIRQSTGTWSSVGLPSAGAECSVT